MANSEELFLVASKLPDKELDRLLLRLRTLRQLDGKEKTDTTVEDSPRATLLYEVILSALQPRGYSFQPWSVFVKKKVRGAHSAQAFVELEENLHAWLAPLLPNESRMTLIAVYRWLVITIVVPRLSRFEQPWPGVVALLRDAAHLIDQHFPGYVASGLLPWAINARVKGVEHVRG